MAEKPTNVELGPKGVVPGRATYQATQVGDQLLLTAKGVHPTTGFRELFEAHNLAAKVPEFAFFFIKPSGIVLDVVTPFNHQDRFKVGKKKLEAVSIADGDGKHNVKVTQIAGMADMRAAMAAVPVAANLSCAEQVRQTVGEWAQNDGFDDDETLGDIIQGRPCDNGQLIALAQILRSRFNVQLSLSCSTPVFRIIDQTCG